MRMVVMTPGLKKVPITHKLQTPETWHLKPALESRNPEPKSKFKQISKFCLTFFLDNPQ